MFLSWSGDPSHRSSGFYKLSANHSLISASYLLNINFDTMSISTQRLVSENRLPMFTRRPNFNNEQREQRVLAEQSVRQQREFCLRQ